MKFSAALFCVLATSVFAAAQSAPATPGTPPEIQAMAYFIGNWSLQGTMKMSPQTPAADFHGKERSEWVQGQYFVETHTDIQGPLGDVRSTRVMEYNPADHVYTYNVYNSLGEHIEAIGNVEGNTWTWTAVQKMNGVATKARYTFNFVSRNAYTFKSEVASPNGDWVTVMQGKANRIVPQQ